MKNQVEFKNLTDDQPIQIIDFDNTVPTITEPLTKTQFIKEYLQEIIDDCKNDGETYDANEVFEMLTNDEDIIDVYITVENGEAKIIVS